MFFLSLWMSLWINYRAPDLAFYYLPGITLSNILRYEIATFQVEVHNAIIMRSLKLSRMARLATWLLSMIGFPGIQLFTVYCLSGEGQLVWVLLFTILLHCDGSYLAFQILSEAGALKARTDSLSFLHQREL